MSYVMLCYVMFGIVVDDFATNWEGKTMISSGIFQGCIFFFPKKGARRSLLFGLLVVLDTPVSYIKKGGKREQS